MKIKLSLFHIALVIVVILYVLMFLTHSRLVGAIALAITMGLGPIGVADTFAVFVIQTVLPVMMIAAISYLKGGFNGIIEPYLFALLAFFIAYMTALLLPESMTDADKKNKKQGGE